MKFMLLYLATHYKLSTQNVLPTHLKLKKRALSVKTQTRMPLVLKEKKTVEKLRF